MERLKQHVRCLPFVPLEFGEIIGDLSGRREAGEVDQVRYLSAYLQAEDSRARTLILEKPYVDRHFMEEFRGYYAASLRAPPAHTARVHVFSESISREKLEGWLESEERGVREKAREKLQGCYLGFIVIRPLPDAPIGRTILAPYRSCESRRFATLQKYRVHLLGFELSVDGVPFQQQEQAVGACATTALWSALASSARATGQRAPTPYGVTEAATRHVLNDRQFPARGGLELQQLLAAIRASGFAPSVLKASEDYALFSHSIKCYLTSGIPVVLLLHEDSGFHAVTAVGYREPDGADVDEFSHCDESTGLRISTPGFARVYVHEDRLGPYARMLWDAPDGQESDCPGLRHLRFASSDYGYEEGPMTVYAAVVPLYPKLRLTPGGLLRIVCQMMPFMRSVFTPERCLEMKVELRFVLGGDYLGELLELGLEEPGRIARFVMEASLPRYLGVIRFFIGDEMVADVLCDTTDIFRAKPLFENVLAVIPVQASYEDSFQNFAKKWLPVCSA
ncbi:hypothetical protein G6O69_34685 [Pseudenhygromyxa sp. WMMC2535]|uniref:hypothetical protein n=1 Tax=Pseudenhygromyxa sp. WMMC2535 TaxID=2712867 RepID=UPI00155355D1|nr:hypothetical protein [Pseudenhygromyxa sp. WMMC2535]NVB43021.1 hypothetical protein [Pseudenhygromyxa sp. WMMC2535]